MKRINGFDLYNTSLKLEELLNQDPVSYGYVQAITDMKHLEMKEKIKNKIISIKSRRK